MNLTQLRILSRSARGLALLPIISAPLLAAQTIAPFRSIEIHTDHTVTFSYKDAAATKVELILDGRPSPLPMERDTKGIWTATTQPLVPEIYGYQLEADGDFRLDPANPSPTINLVDIANLLTVAGDTPQPGEETNVPHGILQHHIYASSAVLGLPKNQSSYYVYTSPGYDAKALC